MMNMLVKTTLSSTLVLGIVACTGNVENDTKSREMISSDVTAFTQHTQKQLEFIGTSVFDKQLSEAMRNKHYEIQVSMLTPFSTSDVPERLDAWLTVVSNLGGEVETKPIVDYEKNAEGTRAFVVPLVPIALSLMTMYQEYRDQKKYEPAKDYNATVFYEYNEQEAAIVKKIVFSHKQKPVDVDSTQ